MICLFNDLSEPRNLIPPPPKLMITFSFLGRLKLSNFENHCNLSHDGLSVFDTEHQLL